MSSYKEDVIRLRKKGKTYDEIENELGCSRGTISYHCQQEGLEDIGYKQKKLSDKKKTQIADYYKNHTQKETAEKFNVSRSTVQKYGSRKGGLEEVELGDNSLFETKAQNDISYTHLFGYIAEQKVVNEALRRGYVVSKPVIESRYDLLVDNGDKIKRVQVKYTDNKRENGYIIDLRSECRNNGYIKTYSENEIDAIIAYISQKDVFVYLPPKIFENQNRIKIRFDETRNNQNKGINFYEDYAW